MLKFLPLYLLSFSCLFFCILSANQVHAQVSIQLSTPVLSGLSQPMQMVSPEDGTNRHFIVQKTGQILVYDAGFNAIGTFLTVGSISTSNERGLLSMVFDPNYETNGYFYVYCTDLSGDLNIRRYSVSTGNPNVANPTAVNVLTIPHQVYANHNGGEMHFGSDGYLYLSTGDGGGGGDPLDNGQNTTTLLGKMLRIQMIGGDIPPYYTVPPGNPYGNLIFQIGLRNPYRWSFDRQTNDMWIGDVGQSNWEEINFRAAASTANTNWGWNCYEGNQVYDGTGCGSITNYTFPVHVYGDGSSITGGVVYRGTEYPNIIGQYIAADHYSGNFYSIVPDGAGGFTTLTQPGVQTGIVDFAEDENGEVYAVSLTAGAVYRLMPESVVPVNLVTFQAIKWKNEVQLYWSTAQEAQLDDFVVEYSTDGHQYNAIATIHAENNPDGAMYRHTHTEVDNGHLFYRLRINNLNGNVQYSSVRRIHFTGKERQFVQSGLVSDRNLRVILPEGYQKLEILNSGGAVVATKNISGTMGSQTIPLPGLASGIYLVVLKANDHFITEKILLQ